MRECTGIRVFMVEDHPAVRQGLRLLLEQEGIQICGEAECIADAIEGVARQHPELVMVDLHLGEEDGLALVRHLAQSTPDLPLLVYSMFEDAAHVDRAMRAGAGAYVTKREAAGVLAHAIRECASGRRYLSPRVEQRQAGAADALSMQEQQVFELLGGGHGTSAIAARLDLSPRTVESYYNRIQLKLGFSGMKELRLNAIAKRP